MRLATSICRNTQPKYPSRSGLTKNSWDWIADSHGVSFSTSWLNDFGLFVFSVHFCCFFCWCPGLWFVWHWWQWWDWLQGIEGAWRWWVDGVPTRVLDLDPVASWVQWLGVDSHGDLKIATFNYLYRYPMVYLVTFNGLKIGTPWYFWKRHPMISTYQQGQSLGPTFGALLWDPPVVGTSWFCSSWSTEVGNDIISTDGLISDISDTGWWFGTCFIFHILGIILPFDFSIFQRGRSTTNQEISDITSKWTLWKSYGYKWQNLNITSITDSLIIISPWRREQSSSPQVAMRALGFEPKKEEIQKMISDVDVSWHHKDGL